MKDHAGLQHHLAVDCHVDLGTIRPCGRKSQTHRVAVGPVPDHLLDHRRQLRFRLSRQVSSNNAGTNFLDQRIDAGDAGVDHPPHLVRGTADKDGAHDRAVVASDAGAKFHEHRIAWFYFHTLKS